MKLRNWLGISALLGAGMLVVSPGARRRWRAATDSVSPALRSVSEEAGRALTAPTDQMLNQARERLVPALPVPADTKWRALVSLVGGMAAAPAPSGGAEAAAARAALLRAGGAALVVSEGAGNDGASGRANAADSIRRAAQALGMAGGLERPNGAIVWRTKECPLIAGTDDPPAMCASICGESGSVLAGLAGTLGLTLESPLRMGEGASHCELHFRSAGGEPPCR